MGSWPKEEGFGLVPRTKNVGMNHLFPDILPAFCSIFSWLWSLGRVLFLSRLFGLVWVDVFLVEWMLRIASETRVNRRLRRYYLIVLLLPNIFALACLPLSSI